MGSVSYWTSAIWTGAFGRTISAAAALAMCLMPAFAPDARAAESKWYAGVSIPLMFIDDTETGTGGNIVTPSGTLRYMANAVTEHETGFKLGGVLGYELGPSLRIEGELFFARASVGKLTYSGITAPLPAPAPAFTLPGETSIPVSGSADQLGAMVNVWYDFDTGSRWTPYVGGGLGFIRVDMGDVKYDSNAVARRVSDALAVAGGTPPSDLPRLPPGYVPGLSAADTAFAYQFGAGVGYRLTDATTVHLGYRLQTTDTLEFSGENATASVNATTDLRVHLFELGIRYRF